MKIIMLLFIRIKTLRNLEFFKYKLEMTNFWTLASEKDSFDILSCQFSVLGLIEHFFLTNCSDWIRYCGEQSRPYLLYVLLWNVHV